MTPLDDVRWGIIGCGDVCEVKSGPALYKAPHSRVVAVMRRNGAKAADFARRHGIPRWYADAEELIADTEVNAVYIATPPGSHAEYALRVAEAGLPAYVEKPMARSSAECTRMVEAFEQAGLPLYVAYYRRTLPQFVWVKEQVEQGLIGTPRLLSIELLQSARADLVADSEENWRIDPERAGGGYFYDLASHQLDFWDFALGPITEVRGLKANQAGLYQAADTVSGTFVFENGLIGQGSWCFAVSENAQRDAMRLVGDEGYLSLPAFGPAEVKYARRGEEEKTKTFALPGHIQQHLVEQIVDHLRGQGKRVVSTGETARRTNWVMEQFNPIT